LKKLL